jgi:hypothetical protein
LVAAVLLATTLAALQLLRGRADSEFESRPLRWWVVIAWIAIWLGASSLAQALHDHETSKLMIPILNLVAIASPIYVLVRLAIAGIRGGSRLRLWGSLSGGMLLGTGLAAALEIMLLLVAVAAGAVYLIANPHQVLTWQYLAAQLAHKANPEKALALLGPMLVNPVALVLALVAVAGVTPLVEEIAKSVPVLALHGRTSTGAQGFWAGALSGAGFALFEGLMVSANAGDGAAFVLMLRAGSSLMHILASGVAGWGIGAFRGSGKAVRLATGYLGAIGLHALWNAVVVTTGYGGIRSTFAAVQPDAFGLALSFGGALILMVLVVLLPVALLGLNLRFRSRAGAIVMAGTIAMPTQAPPGAGTNNEVS